MSNSEKEEEKDVSDPFSLTSKEGQKHLKALNEELKALNEQGSSKLSLLHGPQIEQAQKRTPRKRKLKVDTANQADQRRTDGNLAQKKNPKVSQDLAERRKTQQLKKKRLVSPNATENNVESNGSGCETEIDNILEEKASKAKLSVVNVKNILRCVVKDEQVQAMINHRMKLQDGVEGENEPGVFEPKLTRSKTKELGKEWPWSISPAKNQSPFKRLMLEISDSETSSDEEYQPVSENTFASPGTENEESVHSSPTSESEAINESVATEDADVVEPQSDDNVESTESTIALRTRSKLPLNDTPLEIIEANFIAPDITVDMYDEECDDEEWKEFLGEFLKPLDSNNTEIVDDDANDPEYNFLEEEDVPDKEDLRDDRAVRIPKKELNELMAEVLESDDMYYAEPEDEFNRHELSPSKVDLPVRPNLVLNDHLDGMSDCFHPEELFNYERKQILEEQMRKHVQLLAQMFLLALDNAAFSKIKDMCEDLLMELHTFAVKNQMLYGSQQSSFLSCNLNSALDIISSNRKYSHIEYTPIRGCSNKQKISDKTLSEILHSDAFIYPDILPTCGLKTSGQYKSLFTAAEDNLLALGLEQFLPLKEFSYWDLIQEHMIPIKTSKQILIRVKNLKGKCKDPDNPVKYFYRNNRAPKFVQHVQPFDSDSVCSLYKQGKNSLPELFQTFLSENRKIFERANPSKARPLLPVPEMMSPEKPKVPEKRSTSKQTYVSLRNLNMQATLKKTPDRDKIILEKTAEREVLLKTPEKNPEGRYNSYMSMPILSASPTARITPMKQVSPILKKYKPNSLRKTGGNMKNSRKPLPKLMPKLVVVKKNGPRKLAPKVNAPSAMPSEKPVEKETREELETDRVVAQTTVEVKVSESIEQLAVAIDAIQCTSNDQLPAVNSKVDDRPPIPLNSSQTEVKLQKTQCEPQKDLQATDFRDSGSEAEVEMFDDGDDTVDDELVDVHADNEDDLAALMAASTTIKTNPKQKQSIIKKKKQKSDRKALLAMLSCDSIEMEMNAEKENAFAEAFLQRVKEVVGVNNTYEDFLKALHDFKGSDKSVTQLYKDVCNILNDYPELCDEFVIFLFPEQAMECGKFMEYLNITRMQVFLKKLEVHFGKHPHYIQKLIKVISQVQQLENPGKDDLNKAVMPLLRGQHHLIQEFLQLFPQEPVSESRMTDFEEIYIPNGDEELTSDERGYETIVNLPEQNDIYGGPDCPCSCHSSEKPKIQNRLRHCVECGIKFIDGRIFLQTGKVLKPCQMIYLSPTDSSHQNESDSDPSKQAVHILPSAIISPTTSASSLSPSIHSDDDKGHPPAPEPCGKSQRISSSVGSEAHNSVDNAKALRLSLPSDAGTDDATLSVDSLGKMSPGFVSSDFSAFRQVLSPKALKTQNESLQSSSREARDSSKRTTAKASHNPSDDVGPSDDVRPVESPALNAQPILENSSRWTRECDRTLLQTCQRLKASRETFSVIASQFENRTVEEVEKRFNYLMSVFSEKRPSDDKNGPNNI